MKSGRCGSWVSKDVVKHPWELLYFSLRGCFNLHDTVWFSFWYKLIPVPSCFSVFVYVITAQFFMTVWAIPVWVHPSSGTGSKFSFWYLNPCRYHVNIYNCLIHSALGFNHLAIQNKSHITMKNGFCNLSGYKVFIAHLNGSLDGTLM